MLCHIHYVMSWWRENMKIDIYRGSWLVRRIYLERKLNELSLHHVVTCNKRFQSISNKVLNTIYWLSIEFAVKIGFRICVREHPCLPTDFKIQTMFRLGWVGCTYSVVRIFHVLFVQIWGMSGWVGKNPDVVRILKSVSKNGRPLTFLPLQPQLWLQPRWNRHLRDSCSTCSSLSDRQRTLVCKPTGKEGIL